MKLKSHIEIDKFRFVEVKIVKTDLEMKEIFIASGKETRKCQMRNSNTNLRRRVENLFPV